MYRLKRTRLSIPQLRLSRFYGVDCMKKTSLLFIASTLLLSGCVVGPDKAGPQMAIPAKFAEGSKTGVAKTGDNPWWQNFGDRVLNALVSTGQVGNLDIQQAAERVIAAQASADVAGAGALPQLNASTAASVSGTEGSAATSTGTRRQASAGASVSWFLDFFGQYRRAQEAANASLDAAFDTVEVARLAYLSEAVSAYIDVRYFQEAAALTRKNLASRRQTLELTQAMQTSGQATRADVIRTQALVDNAIADLPPLDTGFHRSANRLATLLGEPAASLNGRLQKGAGQPMPRRGVEVGLPADLIRNRPDIRRAENQLYAATAQIGVAEAQLYPSISLSGTISVARIGTAAVTGNTSSWSFGPTLDLPIFDGGRRKANLEIARSQANEAYLAWKNTVLRGIEEAQTALIALKRSRQTVAAQRQVVKSEEEALTLARESFKAGATSILDVLDAERSVATARLALAADIRQLALDFVTLNVAIGGGATLPGPIAVVATK